MGKISNIIVKALHRLNNNFNGVIYAESAQTSNGTTIKELLNDKITFTLNNNVITLKYDTNVLGTISVPFITDDADDKFIFSDANGNVIASIGADGINSLNYNIIDSTSGEIKATIDASNIEDILNNNNNNYSSVTTNNDNKYILNSENSGFYFSDKDGNVVVYIDADGIHSAGYYDADGNEIKKQEETTTSVASNRFTNKNVFSLCDSLGSGGHWQETFCQEVGAKPFNKDLNGSDSTLKNNGLTLSCGGAATLHKVTFGWDGYSKDGLTSGQQRAINFVNQSVQEYGSKDYLLIENINDFNYFETTDITDEILENPGLLDPVFVEKTLQYNDILFNSAVEARNYFNTNIDTVLSNFTPSVNRSIVLKYGTTAYKFTVANNATTNGILRITINGVNYDTEITSGTSVSDILHKILIFNFNGYDNTSDDESVTISSNSVESSDYTVTVNDSTGAGVTVTKVSSTNYWSSVFTSHDVNDWLDTTKWSTYVTSMRAIMGLIEYLEQKLPNTHLIYVLMPRYPFKWDVYQKEDGTPDERAFKNVDIVKKFEKFLQMQKAVCEYYNLEYIDLAHTMGWNYTNMKNWYGNGTIHFNDNGHEYIGKFLANKLK